MIVMFEYDRKGGFATKVKVERIPLMTRVIWGYWAIAYFREIGINDLAFAKSKKVK